MNKCPGCGAAALHPIMATSTQAAENGGVVRCEACGLVHMSENASRPVVKAAAERRFAAGAGNPRRRENAERTVAMARRMAGPAAKRLFEIGTLDGEILRAAMAEGMEAVGGSASEGIVAAAADLSLPVYALDNLPSDLDGTFDLILSVDHLTASATPGADLETCLRLLCPRGALVLKELVAEDPVAEAASAPAGRCTVFTAATLEAMLAAAGFLVERSTVAQRATIVARRPRKKSQIITTEQQPARVLPSDANAKRRWEEVVTCNHCGTTERTLYMESSVPHWYGGAPLRLEQCSNCGLVYASPRPVAETQYKGYMNASDKAAELFHKKRGRPNVLEGHGGIIDEAASYLARPAKTLFDMGCGAGTVMLAARERGIEAEGNDVNRYSIDHLKGEGFNAHFGFTDQLDLPEGKFDIVTNLDYLEHTYFPMDDLYRCRDILAPGGILYLKTLYLDCPRHLEMGEAWNLFGAGHFHFFPADTLQDMVEHAGLEVLKVKAGGLITIIARKP